MKWIGDPSITTVLTLIGGLITGWYFCTQMIEYKSDQGFVHSEDGQEWRMTRMQTYGRGEEFIPIYIKTK